MSRRIRRLIFNSATLLLSSVAFAWVLKLRPETSTESSGIRSPTSQQAQKRSTRSDSSAAVTVDSTTEPGPTNSGLRPMRTRLIQAQASGDSPSQTHRENLNPPNQSSLGRNTPARSRSQHHATEGLEIQPFESPTATTELPSEDEHQAPPAQIARVEEAKLPLALALPESTLAQLPPQEQSIIDRVQQRFTQDISTSPWQNPDSPEYFSYWKSAQFRQDEQLRLTLGWDRFNRLSALVAQQSESASR